MTMIVEWNMGLLGKLLGLGLVSYRYLHYHSKQQLGMAHAECICSDQISGR